MSISPENWLAMEQEMEQENHVLLQTKITDQTTPEQPQLLLISSHATNGIVSIATFSLIISIGGTRGIA
jgi:hypothetical protein